MEFLNTIANNRLWNKHGLKLMWLIAALLLLLAISRIGWISYSQAKIRAANYAPQDIAPLAQPTRKSYRVQDITGAHLFGDPTPKPVVSNAPKTTLDLTLQGVISASNERTARAIITSDKKKTEIYSIGDSIKGAGASVKEIRATEVLLNRNGATESLPLVKVGKGGKDLITYVDARNPDTLAINNAGQPRDINIDRRSATQQFSAANRQNSTRSRADNSENKKVRKPNFSGLDRALKKMGEL